MNILHLPSSSYLNDHIVPAVLYYQAESLFCPQKQQLIVGDEPTYYMNKTTHPHCDLPQDQHIF